MSKIQVATPEAGVSAELETKQILWIVGIAGACILAYYIYQQGKTEDKK